MDEPDLRICAVCGRVLDYVQDVGWAHTVGDLIGEDHPAVPVKQGSGVPTLGRCDFCYEDDPEFVLPVRQMAMMEGHASSPDWAACATCASFIERDEWNALARRCRDGWVSRHETPMPDELFQSIRVLHRRVRKNMTGALRANPNRNRATPPS